MQSETCNHCGPSDHTLQLHILNTPNASPISRVSVHVHQWLHHGNNSLQSMLVYKLHIHSLKSTAPRLASSTHLAKLANPISTWPYFSRASTWKHYVHCQRPQHWPTPQSLHSFSSTTSSSQFHQTAYLHHSRRHECASTTNLRGRTPAICS